MPETQHFHGPPGHSIGAKDTCAGHPGSVKSCNVDMETGQYDCRHNEPPPKKCLLATACTEYAGLPADCHELEVMRRFRDEYVKRLPDGSALIEKYYEVAPRVLEQIDADVHRDLIYSVMLQRLREVVVLIEAGKGDAAHALYTAEFQRLLSRYDTDAGRSASQN